jgi:hypothetical protein
MKESYQLHAPSVSFPDKRHSILVIEVAVQLQNLSGGNVEKKHPFTCQESNIGSKSLS